MDLIKALLSTVNDYLWGPPIILLIMGTGLFLMIRLRFMPITHLCSAMKLMWQSKQKGDASTGDISPFQALMTCLSATIGTGNIVGVATAIYLGGPGALFWMWCIALVGMATKYSEVVLSVHYREKDASGQFIGGPMLVIKNGMGKHWAWLGILFALFGGLAGFGIGNMVQSNSMADVLNNTFGVDKYITGLVVASVVALVVLGGVKRIGKIAEAIVPAMCILYVLASLSVLIVFYDKIPSALALIVSSAFNPVSATGGFIGSTVLMAIQYGVARGIFSNEAGLGTAGIAQAAGTTTSPVQSGLIGMTGTFIDTIIICTMTGLVIICSGVWTTGVQGAALSAAAFEAAFPTIGGYILAISLVLFTFTTILGWSYYSEKCWTFLLGNKTVTPFRCAWVLAVFLGAVFQLDTVWMMADILNALMAIPNLISLICLSAIVLKLTNDYFSKDN
jgi:AGCS family alanine or glycine:cation symporter